MQDGAVSELVLPVTTFRRVFDTMPVQEVLTLAELALALRRFELRPDVLARSQREIARARRATTRVKAGLHAGGGFEARLRKSADDAKKAHADPAAAMEATGLRLEDEARKKVKGDLRVWSPTLYAPGADKRGGEQVTHLCCIVLDHDDGTDIEDASARWSQYFHLVHSTWSHTDDKPRFRLVLPLAHLVPVADWARVWSWAAQRSGGTVDGALKNPSSHYALPAVPHLNWPRVAFCRPGAILSPHDEGLVASVPDVPLVPQGPTDGEPSVMRGLDPTRRFVDHVADDSVYLDEDPWEGPAGGTSAPTPTSVEPEPTLAQLAARVRDLEQRVAASEGVGALERLARLHREGVIDDTELAAAKRRVLALASGEPPTRGRGPGPSKL